jgi:hypothetical protein
MALQQIEIAEMIDWYDGIVVALVTTNWIEGIYLCSLLAFDANLKKRVFALLPLDESEVSEIKSRLGGEWEALISYLRFLWDKASGSVTLVCYRDMDEQIIAEKVVDASRLKNQAISDVEEAVSDNRRSWFSLF